MPYKTNKDINIRIRKHLPQGAQTIFRKAFNSAYDKYDEPIVFRIAWAAVKKSYKKQGDKWVKR